MAFRVTARTLLHLGAELISSDGVALYELIKNAFDARSRRVSIDVQRSLKEIPAEIQSVITDLKRADEEQITEGFRRAILSCIDELGRDARRVTEELEHAANLGMLRKGIKLANAIVVEDTGDGMSLAELDDVYLTIGTRSRLREKHSSGRPVLGEKGLGRLAVMRLGQRLRVVTSRATETHWNVLEIDWSIFSHSSDRLLEEIDVKPRRGELKADPNASGTSIEIRDLAVTWTENRLRDIAKLEISRLMDPFARPRQFPVRLSFNGNKVEVPTLDEEIFERAHATVEAELRVSTDVNTPTITLAGRIDYRLRNREKTFTSSLPAIAATANATPAVLRSLGPWTMKVYWFNRKLLVEEGPDGRAARDYVNEWSGGVMVFRDGFRVYPYGSKDDDWLDLDRRALASSGYKVNRKQLIGKLDISGLSNPRLNDQTNREGLRESPEKEALVYLLKHVLEAQFRAFLNRVDSELSPKLQVTFEVLAERVDREEKNLRANLRLLRAKHPEIEKEMPQTFVNLEGSVEALRKMMGEAKELADEIEAGHEQLVHLAGLGLMVEMLAHELNRSTAHALGTLAAAKPTSTQATRGVLETLEFQLQTLQKRLRTLDPATTSGRQRKQQFDLVVAVKQVLAGHNAEFERHGISGSVVVKPDDSPMSVHMVKGMVIQILENLIGNAAYWLKNRKLIEPAFSPTLMIVVDSRDRQILVSDNGPGVDPTSAEDIFQPFYTTKPPGEGKGLGLYIARELAKYHRATLTVPDTAGSNGRINTFILGLPPE